MPGERLTKHQERAHKVPGEGSKSTRGGFTKCQEKARKAPEEGSKSAGRGLLSAKRGLIKHQERAL